MSEIRSRDDATLARSGDTELRLVSIGPLKLVARLSAREIYLSKEGFVRRWCRMRKPRRRTGPIAFIQFEPFVPCLLNPIRLLKCSMRGIKLTIT